MTDVLIVATKYDTQTRATHRWAETLEKTLKALGHSCTLLSGKKVVPGALAAQVKAGMYVFFYGHGLRDSFTAQRTWLGSDPALVDCASVGDFKGQPGYAVCCRALLDLGDDYAATFPQGAFVGYGAAFGFSTYNRAEFENVVTTHAVSLVGGASATQVAGDLESAWKTLSDDFFNGAKATLPDAFAAAYAAAGNALFVGVKP